jgi:hypothetical protein
MHLLTAIYVRPRWQFHHLPLPSFDRLDDVARLLDAWGGLWF